MENINEGKTKIIEDYSEHLVKITTKNVLTAFDSIKKDELDVGKDKTKQACEVFKYLEKHGVATPFVEQVDDTSFIAKKCDMLPYECVIRRRAYGSFLKRNPIIEEATYFYSPIKEFFHKHSIVVESDSTKNRMMPESQARWSFLSEDGKWSANVITDPFMCFNWLKWAEHSDMNNKTGFKIDIYNLNGEVVETLEDSFLLSGSHSYKWEPTGLANGIYFINYLINNNIHTQKITLLK